jgi:hypothetical protein
MTTHPEAERRFLAEGAETFVPTLNAVAAFRELVQARCRQVLQRHLAAYSAALRVPLTMHRFQPYQYPRPTQWDGQWVSVGLEARWVGTARVWLFQDAYWELGEQEKWSIQVGVCMWLSKRDQPARLWKVLRSRPRNLYFSEDEREVGLYESVTPPAEFSAFDKKMEAILRRWIKLWQRVGGLKVLTAGSTRKTTT